MSRKTIAPDLSAVADELLSEIAATQPPWAIRKRLVVRALNNARRAGMKEAASVCDEQYRVYAICGQVQAADQAIRDGNEIRARLSRSSRKERAR